MSRADWAPVLLYHQVVERLPDDDPHRNCVRADVFDAQLSWLSSRGFRSTTLQRLGTALKDGSPLPPRSVVITFDDGYASNLEVAWPILQRHGFTATIFVVTGCIGGFNEFDAGEASPPARMLSAGQVRALHAAGVEIGSHTVTHPTSLCAVSEERLQDELVRSRGDLEALLDAPVTCFSYPHSQADGRVERAVGAAGYQAACAGVGAAFRPLRLSRVDPASRAGVGLEAMLQWRRLKWLARLLNA